MFTENKFNIRTRSPEALWREIEQEAGPFDRIDVDGMKRALELALIEATIRGDSVVQVPVKIAERILADLRAQQQRGRSFRPNHRPRKNWWLRRWEQTAVAHFDHRRRELMIAGQSRDDAIQQAAGEIAGGFFVRPATLISWWDPGRLRRK